MNELQATGELLAKSENGGQIVAESPTDILGIMAMAVQRDLDIDKLKQLCELEERYYERQRREEFYKAKAKFQGACPVIEKRQTADTGKFRWKFADLGGIESQIKEHLAKQKLSYKWDTEWSDDGTMLVTCTLTHSMGFSETATFKSSSKGYSGGLAQMPEVNRTSAAETTGKRRSLISVLGIGTADEDTDAQGSEPPPKPSKGIGKAQLEQLKRDWFMPRRDDLISLQQEERAGLFSEWVRDASGSTVPDHHSKWTPEQYDACLAKIAEESNAK